METNVGRRHGFENLIRFPDENGSERNTANSNDLKFSKINLDETRRDAVKQLSGLGADGTEQTIVLIISGNLN